MTSIKQHLLERHCNLELYGNSVVIDEEERVATFLLWNFSGQLIGYQQYRPDNHEKAVKNHPDKRYYLYVGDEGGDIQNKSKRRNAIFGIETLKMFPNGPVVLVEGIFDAARFHNSRIAALGMMSSNPKKAISFLQTIHRKKVAVCDSDESKEGEKLAKYGDVAIYLKDGHDVGDLHHIDFVNLMYDINDV